MQARRRRVKIIATLGPASSDRETIADLFAAGADVFRINMSHASHDVMRERVAMIRSLEEETGRPIGVLVDLQGPKLRLGSFAGGAVDLHKGDIFALDGDPSLGGRSRIYLPHPEILSSLAPGHRILIDDGKVLLRVLDAAPGRASTIVEVAGRVSDKKGVSLPDTTIPTSAMTDKDRADLAAALEENIDWIALSFVQRPEDIAEVKEIAKGRALVMAKIEKPQAVQRVDEIMAVADALMVARGDLGVEMPLERVPGIQKTLTRLARRLGKPVVVATQMLESMITAPVPTRAEVSDVATAVFEGADAIMLSAESASGQYPREAVATMNRIAEAVESEEIYPSIIEAQRAAPEATGADAIAEATRDVAETLDLKVICAWTSSGSTGLRIARQRPRSSILALTPDRIRGAAPRCRLGRASDRHRRRARRARHGRSGLPPRLYRGLRRRGRAYHRGRRRAVRDPGRHQQPAHRDRGGLSRPCCSIALKMAESLVEPSLLIVGSGPAGLFAACELVRHGVKPRIVERRLAPHHETRGTALQPAVLDIIDRAGLIEPFISGGVHIKHSQLLGPGMRPIISADFAGLGCRYEFQCSQPQWRTEQILRNHLARHGVAVEYGVEVAAIDAGPETLRVTLDVAGRTEVSEPRYLLGAGGAHSVTRHSMEEHLVGETYGGQYVVADVKLGLAIPPETARVIVGAAGFVLFAPLPDRRWLIFASRDPADTRNDPPTTAELGATVNARIGADAGLSDLRWVSYFKMHRREAESLSDGRRFLLGDAGHMSSPLGGEGINAAFMDAADIAWKLALV